MAMELVSPSADFLKDFEDALHELHATNGLAFWHELGPPASVEEYIRIRLDHAESKNLPEGWVASTTFWLVEDGELIGETVVRHELTDHLRNIGGQIGYWIRPSKRNKGYGRLILQMALQKAKALGLEKIVITCDENNIGSRKIIEFNGGVFERCQDMGLFAPPKMLFWIDIP